jgi:Uncharacterized protein related to capsule biosynthesis enzymes
MKESLKVMLWNNEIGRLAWDKRRNRTYFTYNPVFLEGGLDIAPLVAPIKGVRSRLPIYGEDDSVFQKLPSFLADSLPDDWGNRLFECWRTENKIANADVTPLEKLSFIGKRGMGALEFEPEVSRFNSRDKIDVESLINLAQRIFAERENVCILPEESLTLQSLIAVGTSAGGRQPKAIIAINHETGEIRSGQIAGLEGYDYCILKFGDPERSSAELEMVYYEMSRLAGIQMMESRLMDVEGLKHFLTKRFDRDETKRLHTQTLAALYPETDSYEKLLWVCRKMRLSEKDCEEVFRRLVFNLLAHNTDDHNKNFSFIMDEKGNWRLSPAYDMTFVFNKGGFQPQEERCFMIRGKLINITKQDVLDFAKDNGIRRPDSIINEVARAVASFRELAIKYNVKEEWTTRIEACLSVHLADWEFASTSEDVSFELDGHKIANASIEQAYRGNLHLLASIDGRELKYVFRQGTEEYGRVKENGITNLPKEILMELVEKYLLSKIK